jgi:proteasome accessory factor A
VHNFYAVELDDTVDFQLSQRADHILKTVASKVRFNRAIINPKWDSYYNFSNLHRLHLLFGEANMSEWGSAMKAGTTSLVLDLVEDGLVPPEVRVADPIETLRSVSRDPSWKWIVRLADGRTMPAIDLQRIYLGAAQRHLSGRDAQTDWVLREWDYALTGLEADPMLLDDRVDWVAKRKLLEMYRAAENLSWHDDIMYSLDLEYHNINPDRGLYYGLVEAGQMKRILDDARVDAARTNAPPDTRAAGRGKVIRDMVGQRTSKYVIDWDGIYLERERYLDLRNPFHTYETEACNFVADL